ALAILLGLYGVLFTPQEAAVQAVAFARLLPPGSRPLFEGELTRLAHAPITIVSTQSAIAVLISFYASQRGVKALLAGLTLIHDEPKPRGIVSFNLLAAAVALAGFGFLAMISAALLAVRVAATTFYIAPFSKHPWLFSEWTWAG